MLGLSRVSGGSFSLLVFFYVRSFAESVEIDSRGFFSWNRVAKMNRISSDPSSVMDIVLRKCSLASAGSSSDKMISIQTLRLSALTSDPSL